MAQERPDTPEKQLLRLIEDPRARNTNKAQIAKRRGINIFSPGAWAGRTSFLKKGLAGWLKGQSKNLLDIKTLIRALGLCNLALFVYFTINFSNSIAELNKKPEGIFEVKSIGVAEEDTEAASLLKPESFYLDRISKRNIFEMGKIIKDDIIDEPQVQLAPTTSPAVEATQHLKLVGISWSSEPDAMVEDTRALRTFFVKKGQVIGEVEVKDILRDRVVLSYEGDEVELR